MALIISKLKQKVALAADIPAALKAAGAQLRPESHPQHIESMDLEPYKDIIVSQIKTILFSELKQIYNIDYTDYGSSAMGLDIESSDRDILIFFETKNKSYFLSPIYFYQKVKEFALKYQRNIKVIELSHSNSGFEDYFIERIGR